MQNQMCQIEEIFQERQSCVLPSITDPRAELHEITSMDGLTLNRSFIPHSLVYQEKEQEPETITEVVEIPSSQSTPLVPPPETPPLSAPKPKCEELLIHLTLVLTVILSFLETYPPNKILHHLWRNSILHLLLSSSDHFPSLHPLIELSKNESHNHRSSFSMTLVNVPLVPSEELYSFVAYVFCSTSCSLVPLNHSGEWSHSGSVVLSLFLSESFKPRKCIDTLECERCPFLTYLKVIPFILHWNVTEDCVQISDLDQYFIAGVNTSISCVSDSAIQLRFHEPLGKLWRDSSSPCLGFLSSQETPFNIPEDLTPDLTVDVLLHLDLFTFRASASVITFDLSESEVDEDSWDLFL
ncbi:hypothetical protein Tco_1386946 [Tanacetum coccineum]